MFIAQLAAFLIGHHHAHWAALVTTDNGVYLRAVRWTLRHGFVFQP